MRLFLAVIPPPEVQRAAAEAAEALRRDGPRTGASWVKRENLHFTVRFLGEVGEDGARRAAEAAREGARGHAPFHATLAGFGAFPNARRARVLWIGVEQGAEPLRALAASVEASLERRGFGRADHAFSAHLTVARVREPGDWSAALAAARSEPARFEVARVCVVESRLNPKGSIYTIREEGRLEG